MGREPLEFDDDALRRYFAAANEELDADEFAARVLRRAERRSLIRRIVLGTAIAVALLLSFGPLLETLRDLARLLGAASEWREAAWYRDNALVVVAALATAAWPFVARWLAR
jgi:hypothetical protein